MHPPVVNRIENQKDLFAFVCLSVCLFFFQIYFGLNTNRAIKISPMLKQKPYNTI